ncbi:hypothetical protein [Cupriavidus alkaliphilus]|uniref:hypothetical protein n=1 Tax=Cupriavidus alkaliphilus TaxID=942866 RepID=UPI0016183433|nr:hypothetical protein [Cupriavidus alkaliphilus]MBB3014013.1 hypothetical protein [Cupriavidus alkaliphilus]
MTQRLNDFQQSPELSKMLMELREPAERRLPHGAGFLRQGLRAGQGQPESCHETVGAPVFTPVN